MNPQEALEAMCNRCHKNTFRNISDDHCEEYETIKKALAKAKAFDILNERFEFAVDGNADDGNSVHAYGRFAEAWNDIDEDEAKTIKEALK